MTKYKCLFCGFVDGSCYDMKNDLYLCPICGLVLEVVVDGD